MSNQEFRISLLILWIVLCGNVVYSQEPIPTVPPSAQGNVVGRVVDSEGNSIPGVQVTISGPAISGSRTVTTGVDGTFRTPLLPPGKYSVQASLPGFSTFQKEVEVRIGAVAKLEIVLGPIPETGPGRITKPVSSSSTPPESAAALPKQYIVTQVNSGDELALQETLDTQATNGRHLIAVIPRSNQQSLVVFSSVDTCERILVLPVNRSFDADSLQKRIQAHSEKRFVGVHLIDADSYLVIFCYE